MPITELNTGIPMDFSDVILIINAFAIAILFGVLYIDQIVVGWKRLAKALNPLDALARLKTRLAAHKVPH